jgi:hypothetical protein
MSILSINMGYIIVYSFKNNTNFTKSYYYNNNNKFGRERG